MRANAPKVAVVLLAVASLYSAARYLHSIKDLDTYVTGDDAVAAWEARLTAVREALPVERGVVGYLAEWDVPGIEYALGDVEAEYFLSQYALAPLILVRGAETEWTVAILDKPALEIWEQMHPGAYEVIELRNRIYLLRRLNEQ